MTPLQISHRAEAIYRSVWNANRILKEKPLNVDMLSHANRFLDIEGILGRLERDINKADPDNNYNVTYYTSEVISALKRFKEWGTDDHLNAIRRAGKNLLFCATELLGHATVLQLNLELQKEVE